MNGFMSNKIVCYFTCSLIHLYYLSSCMKLEKGLRSGVYIQNIQNKSHLPPSLFLNFSITITSSVKSLVFFLNNANIILMLLYFIPKISLSLIIKKHMIDLNEYFLNCKMSEL